MELRQLLYFVTVVEEASFTRAAARLHLAQPGVSAQVRQLEHELGVDLLDRSGRSVRLTEAGAAVLGYARAALDAAAGARLAADDIHGLVRGHVTVGMVTACTWLPLPDLLAGFHGRHPGVRITLAEANSDELLQALRSGQLDLAFVGLGPSVPPRIAIQVVADEPLVAAVAPGDALASSDTMALAGVRDRPLISLPAGTGVRACLDHGCGLAGFQAHVAFEASDPHILAQLAAKGLGVAILPQSVATAHEAELHAIRLVRPEMRGRVALAWREGGTTSPAARALIRHARTTLGEDAQAAGDGAAPSHRADTPAE